ncbi:sugar-phosphatase [Pedococcus dokdonensis]|uniref:Sugar-phosphatase n=1 Tax=Pedococcus dokdonensis TaxID=443156 RepID=A0A1H0TB70_9MICO|nr:HAD-IA family hydrolase [Pedococcus dokdonensis]SDP51249.1 sugar-phosphatase [Pedococcus dokdonensis]
MPRSLGTLEGRTFAAVLFDMDGTLIDSIPVVVRSWVRWAQEEGVDPHDLAGFHGVPARGVISALLPPERVESAFERIEAIEVADTDGIEVLPGTLDALAALTGDVELCAIATSCTRPLADARLAATALPAPRVVVTASDVAQGKPHPDPFLLAATGLGVDSRDCLVVEDAPGGLEAARAAGCATLAVTTTTAPADLVADAVVRNLADVRFSVVDGRVRVAPAADSVTPGVTGP